VKYGVMAGPNASMVGEVEIDQGTLEVSNAAGNVGEDDWEEVGLDEFSLMGPVQHNSDGLRYRCYIEVMDWWEATGEGFEDEEGNEIPTYLVSLYVVPVSVPKEVVEHCHGGSSDLDEQLDECFKKHGDYRDFVWDIHSYGHHVPIPVKGCFGIKCKDSELEFALKSSKEAAFAVHGMFGFYMDRPWNAVGWDGWKALRDAKAFPGQHGITKVETRELARCNDCGEETHEWSPASTIYTRGDSTPICSRCLEDYYWCPDCGVGIPIQPQSYSGVEWVEINHQKYCAKCAETIYNDGECPKVVAGGTVLSMDGVKENQQALHMVDLHAWERVAEWETGWYERSVGEAQIAKYICEWIEREGPEKEYIFGPYEFGQFHARIGLFQREVSRDA